MAYVILAMTEASGFRYIVYVISSHIKSYLVFSGLPIEVWLLLSSEEQIWGSHSYGQQGSAHWALSCITILNNNI